MPIAVHCSCGMSEEVPDDFAGKKVRCKTCGARVVIGYPATRETESGPADGSTLAYAGQNRGNVVISRERMLAGRSCFCWGGLMIAIAFFLGLAILAAQMGPRAGKPAAVVIAGLMLLVLVGIASTYIIGGIQIRRGGMAWVIVCLVLASVQMLFCGMATVLYGFGALMGQPFMLIAVVISLLAAAAFGQLDYYLIKVLREPRVV